MTASERALNCLIKIQRHISSFIINIIIIITIIIIIIITIIIGF